MKFHEGQSVAVWTSDGFRSATVIATQRAFGMFDSRILAVRMPNGRVHYADRKDLRLRIMNGSDLAAYPTVGPTDSSAMQERLAQAWDEGRSSLFLQARLANHDLNPGYDLPLIQNPYRAAGAYLVDGVAVSRPAEDSDSSNLTIFAARMLRRIARLEGIEASDLAPYRKLTEYRKLVKNMRYDYDSLLADRKW
jgi:hypothetical protein